MFKINSLHFVTKTFAFNIDKEANYCRYKRFIKQIGDNSLFQIECSDIKDKKLLNPFIDDFFEKYGSNHRSRIELFDGVNYKKCVNSDFSLFYLRKNVISLFFDALNRKQKFYFNEMDNGRTIQELMIDDFDEMIKIVESLNDSHNKEVNGLLGSFIKEAKQIDFAKNINDIEYLYSDKETETFPIFAESYGRLKSTLKRIENSHFYNNSLGDDYRKYKKAYKLYEKNRRAVNVISLFFQNAIVVNFVLLSKYGVASIGAISELETLIDATSAKGINDALRKIKRRTTRQIEIFEILTDFPFVFEKTAFDKFELLLDEPSRKGVYLNFLYDNKNKELTDKSYIRKAFDFISVALCYEHNFHEEFLWNYSTNTTRKEENKNSINDLIDSDTEHFYYDDNCFVFSVINPAYVYDINPTLSNELGVYKVSHQSKIYSLWTFESICESLAFGSIGIRILKMFNVISSNSICGTSFQLSKLHKYHKFTKLSASLLATFDLDLFAAKNYSSIICKIVFMKLGLSNIVAYSSTALDNKWKDANLLNTQAYSRFGLFLSIGTALITIFSYGMISKVYIDGYRINAEQTINEPPKDWLCLIYDAIKTQKMWLAFAFPLFALLVMFVIYLIERTSFIKANIIKHYNIIVRKVRYKDVLDHALREHIIKKTKNGYWFEDNNLGKKKSDVIKNLSDNKETLKRMVEKIKEKNKN